MDGKTASEDAYYEQQILETNELGNALLAGKIANEISEKKRKIINKIQIVGDLNTYKSEIEKLRSLKIANIHKILNIHERNDMSVQVEAAEKLLKKIEEILMTHVKYNAKNIISKQELEQLKNHMNLLQSFKENINDIPNTSESKLRTVEEFTDNLHQIVEYIEETSAKVNESQMSVIRDASEMMSLTNQNCTAQHVAQNITSFNDTIKTQQQRSYD